MRVRGSSRASCAAAEMPSSPGISMSSSATSACRCAGGLEHEVAALDLGDDLDVVLEREQAGERAAHHRLVLGDQDADHALERQREPQAEAAPGSRPGLERAVQAARPLGEAGEARSVGRSAAERPRRRRRPASETAVVARLERDRRRRGRRCGGRRSSSPRAAPRRARSRPRPAARRGAVHAQSIPAAERAARALLERLGEREPPVAVHRRAHLGQRLPGHALDVGELGVGGGADRSRRASSPSSLLSAIDGQASGRAGRAGRGRSAGAPR